MISALISSTNIDPTLADSSMDWAVYIGALYVGSSKALLLMEIFNLGIRLPLDSTLVFSCQLLLLS